MELKEIQNLIKFVAKSGASEVALEMDDIKITIKTLGEVAEHTIVQQMPMPGYGQMPVAPAVAAPVGEAAAAVPAEDEDSKYIAIKSPMIGTIYRKPTPEKPAFVKVGDEISAGDVVCIIEAMKLFNEIESEVSGRIVKVLVDDNSPIEYDQPLFLVDPS
ncbi:MAG: acetyl-CoA carboxylase biotin carboxyl carrier protein [Ichthyobacteriaceae bacterium]|nr:acetyl-CoA carboxylase biotin carboxyl carrier protein [Ichthyobacteriaceae bacterium]